MYATVHGIERAIENMATEKCHGCDPLYCVNLSREATTIVRVVCPVCEQMTKSYFSDPADLRRKHDHYDGRTLNKARCPYGREIRFKLGQEPKHKRCVPKGGYI